MSNRGSAHGGGNRDRRGSTARRFAAASLPRRGMRSVLAKAQAFGRADNANIVLWFAFMLLPILLAAGAAVDYARAATLRTKLQQATDAATLAIAPFAGQKTDAELRAMAENFLRAAMASAISSMGGRDVRIDSITISADRGDVTVVSSAGYEPMVMSIVSSGGEAMTVSTLSRTIASDVEYEIALVIDNSGSMSSNAGSQNKMQATKAAAIKLVDAMFSTPQAVNRTKIALVPFNLSVNTGGQVPSMYTDTAGRSEIHWPSNIFEGRPSNPRTESATWPPQSRFDLFAELAAVKSSYGWGGCFEMRPGAIGTTDTPPVTSPVSQADFNTLFVPQFWPDEPDANNGSNYRFTSGKTTTTWTYLNSYLNDNTANACKGSSNQTAAGEYVKAQNKLCKYRSAKVLSGGDGPNYLCSSQALTRLTNNASSLKTKINQMVADGGTNLVEGFMWGWRTLSPRAPFADGKAYTERRNRKIIIMMTDGNNQWLQANNHNDSYYSPFGFYTNNRIASGLTTTQAARNAMDAKTLEACNNAKAAGLIVYTIGFDTGSDIDAQGKTLLRDCASADSSGTQKLTYIATDSADIVEIFNNIARQLGSLRLAQ
ncbi:MULTISPECIES: TadE/TadG family type IV pilus assembly protein [unclassified Chelatococcus]|uniref:TadE/TadG family type IV pilus assembly protein n=1 Tax=unclassified Chelatococcus TaxID=2638111 RepID=UPI001BCC1102|nr:MULTISPECIES: TadE/TadG family type IV pilus assembly protein [unclassified Chelatococcus]MBS7697824.1 hypothetical protein [Chelatococcus sp. YT9]MBX3559821.1 hypothetical protein [Chelatococcus sp.]